MVTLENAAKWFAFSEKVAFYRYLYFSFETHSIAFLLEDLKENTVRAKTSFNVVMRIYSTVFE